jgi:hypothetical protein
MSDPGAARPRIRVLSRGARAVHRSQDMRHRVGTRLTILAMSSWLGRSAGAAEPPIVSPSPAEHSERPAPAPGPREPLLGAPLRVPVELATGAALGAAANTIVMLPLTLFVAIYAATHSIYGSGGGDVDPETQGDRVRRAALFHLFPLAGSTAAVYAVGRWIDDPCRWWSAGLGSLVGTVGSIALLASAVRSPMDEGDLWMLLVGSSVLPSAGATLGCEIDRAAGP